MCPLGWLPAEKARNRPCPARLSTASAMIERAELPVQMNSTLNTLFGTTSSIVASLRHAMTGAVDHQLAVLLAILAALRRGQEIEHCLRRPAQLDAERRDHDRPVDENGMRHHRIEKLVIRDGR